MNSMKKFQKLSHKYQDEKQLETLSKELLDVQYTRDFLILRYYEAPHLMFLHGSSYYGGVRSDAKCIDLREKIPFDLYSRGLFCRADMDNFYREIVQVEIQNIGYIVYCDYSKFSRNRMSQLLLKSTDQSLLNNHLLFDITITTE